MCGISAIFGNHVLVDIERYMTAMTQLIRHRGPDDEGYVFFSQDRLPATVLGGKDTPSEVFNAPFSYCPKHPKHQDEEYISYDIAFGHRRLSILDLSPAGHQPMGSKDQSVWITYNGEVYNYLEIRKELEALGHRFLTQTDTEVIIKGYQQWGKQAFHRLNGMFAFVIYDRIKRKALAVRDRFGVKPLYYWLSPLGFLVFASEIKQFTALPGWNPLMNEQLVYDFLNWGVIDHTSETLFSHVFQLRGGEYLEFCPENFCPADLQPKKWYTLNAPTFQGSLEEASKKFCELLEDSIKLRLRADVAIGSCLSGGLDSSSIVCLTNRLLGEKLALGKQKTFSACSDVKRFDERHFIDTVVGATHVEAHYTYPHLENLFDECWDIAWHQDEPFTSTSIYAQWLVFKLVKEKQVKVMLDGQGADEQLAGYLGFFGNRFYDLFSKLRWKTLYREILATARLHGSLRPFPMLLDKVFPDVFRRPMRKIMRKDIAKPNWLNISLLGVEERNPQLQEKNKSILQQSRLQISQTSLPMLLHYEDRDSMAHSIESRTPFLDYRLVEFTLGLPSDYKISNGWTKHVLRESMKGILPEEIRSRTDKLGFVTAEEEWIKKQDPERFRQALDQAVACSRGVLHPSAKLIVDQMISGQRPFSFLPWRLISFGYWMERFSVKI
jgi:asparagine synthase (glutamine-hydrolysing)